MLKNIEITKEQQKINKQHMDEARKGRKEKLRTKNARYSRTRTLIQLGGLMDIVGFPKKFNIKLGDDLQIDLLSVRKSAVLLGALQELIEQLPSSLIDAKRSVWRETGFELLKREKKGKKHDR